GRRMGMADQMHQFISTDIMLPAVAQGTLGIQTRDADSAINALVERLNDPETVVRTKAERAFLSRLEGGCQVPIAAYATLEGDSLHLKGLVGEVDGSVVIRREITGAPDDAEALGTGLADEVLMPGGVKFWHSSMPIPDFVTCVTESF
ncbi:MAG: hypothetical protein Q9M29_03895, partial [Mariprofundaceae bacterium]|nr:hypothetical protein [Mariprofundaceae bacterium]